MPVRRPPSPPSSLGAFAVLKPLTRTQSLSTNYSRNGDRQRGSLVHTFRSIGQRSLQVRTELGMDVYRRAMADSDGLHHCYFNNRTEYLLDTTGRNRLGLQTWFEREQWTVMLFVAFNSRTAFGEGGPMPLERSAVDPFMGGIRGRVFVDTDADGRLGPGEPGLEGVKVVSGSAFSTVTDQRGRFLLPGLAGTDTARVALDLDTVPATYSPTHGKQMATVRPGNLTVVNLGVAPVVAVLGIVQVIDDSGPAPHPLAGVRVVLNDRKTGRLVAESVTAGDGSYYLGNVLAGSYLLGLDERFLPSGCTPSGPPRPIRIPPSEEPEDVQVPPMIVRKATNPPS